MTLAEFLRSEHWLGRTAGPRYVQLRRRLEEAIQTGLLPPKSSLPPEREIAEVTDLSRVTVRKAIQELASAGLIDQRHGSGSFVRAQQPRVEQSLSHLTSFTEDMRRRGMTTRSKWLERGVFLPAPEEIVTLGLTTEDQVARIYRLRMAEDRPLALEKASLPLWVLPNPLDVDHSLYEVLAAKGHRPVRAIQKISAVNLEPTEAGLLNVAEGTAGLSIERISYLESGQVAEFTRSLYRGDAYDFVAELRLSG